MPVDRPKVLCICSAGNSRSVGTRFILYNQGYEALSCGIDINRPETILMLANWADKILCAEVYMQDKLPEEVRHKVEKEFVIGPYIWQNPLSHDLHSVVLQQLAKIGW